MAQQNLIENGSFENYSACPNGLSQITNSTGWMSFHQTPDYHSECATSPYVMVPGNLFGYQYPFEGIAYVGIWTYSLGLDTENYELIASELLQPLQAGSLYHISFRVCPGIKDSSAFAFAINHIGVKFTNKLYSTASPMPIDASPHFDYPFFITDTVNWTLVSGWYTPDSNYTYMAIGNFFPGSQTGTINVTNYFNPGAAYTYIDSVNITHDIGDGINAIADIAPRLFSVPANEWCIASMGTNHIDKTELINLVGQKVNCIATTEGDRIRIETSGLPSGSYLVKLHDREKSWTIPLIVQH